MRRVAAFSGPAPSGLAETVAAILALEEEANHAKVEDHDAIYQRMEPYTQRAIATRATTAQDLAARLAFVELHMPNRDCVEHADLSWEVVRSLVEDVRAVLTDEDHADLWAEAAAILALAPSVNAKPLDKAAVAEWERRCDAFNDAVEALPCTPENAAIKARAVQVLYDGKLEDFGEPLATTDVRLAIQVLRCVLGGKEVA